jgi:hypothetical protein
MTGGEVRSGTLSALLTFLMRYRSPRGGSLLERIGIFNGQGFLWPKLTRVPKAK